MFYVFRKMGNDSDDEPITLSADAFNALSQFYQVCLNNFILEKWEFQKRI